MQDARGEAFNAAQPSDHWDEFFTHSLPITGLDEGFSDTRAIMGDAMMIRMLESVLQEAEIALAALQGSCAEQDLMSLRQDFHRAAGSASVIGALCLANALHSGERAIIDGDMVRLRSCDTLIQSSIASTADYLQRLQAGSD